MDIMDTMDTGLHFYFMSVIMTGVVILVVYYFCHRKSPRLTIKNKAVLISGCDTGIGLRVAQHLSSLGFTVFAGCLDHEGSEGARKLMKDQEVGRPVHIIALDVTDKQSILSATSSIRSTLSSSNIKGLWAVVNNAGVCIYGEFDWMTQDQIEKQVNVNLLGSISLTKAVLPLIKEAKGRIINVGSINGLCAYPGLSIYSATKFALEGFSDVLRYELSKLGIKVVLIRPGDFARLTGLMLRQMDHSRDMWREMTDRDRVFYKEYFDKYHQHIAENYGMTSPPSFEQSTLLQDFEDALLSPDPSFAVTVSPLSFRLAFFVIRILPPAVKDRFLDFLYAKVFQFDIKTYFPNNNNNSRSGENDD